MIRIALAGLGVHGARYARHLLAGDVSGATLAAVCRSDLARGGEFAARHGVAVEPDVESLARRPDVDAVVLALRPDLHARSAEAALAAGKPVLVEKPLAHTAAEARRIAALDPGGRRLMVAHTLRFDAVVEALRDRVASLGRLDLISIDQHFEPATRDWLDVPGPGGVLLNTAVHGLDLLRYLTGLEPLWVTAETARRATARTADVVVVTVRLGPDGVLGTVRNARTTGGRSGRIELVGEHGQWIGDHVHRTLARVEGRTRIEERPIPERPTLPATLRAFVDALTAGRPMPVSGADGAIAVAMAEAAERSADTGRRVDPGTGRCYRNETSS